MPEYLAPGVFVEEIDAGSKPIEGVGVSTAAFVGYAKSGEFNKPTFISSWTEFCKVFGEDEGPVLKALATEYGKSVVELLTARRAVRKSLADFTADYIKANGAHNGKAKTVPEFYKKHDSLPRDSSPYIEGTYLAYAVRGFYDNGGGRCYVVRVARPEDLHDLNYVPSVTAAPTAATLSLAGLEIKAKALGPGGNEIKAEVAHEGDDGFTITFSHAGKSDTLGSKAAPLKPGAAGDVVSRFKSSIVEVSVATEVKERPKAETINLSGGSAGTSSNLPALPLAAELKKVTPNEFLGDPAKRSGVAGLLAVDDVNFIAVPDLMAGVWKREEVDGADLGPEVLVMDEKKKQTILDAQAMLVAYCEGSGDRMAILDPIPGLTPQEMRDTVMNSAITCEHGQAAVYYPWIKVVDQINHPGGKRFQTFVPPSGHIAGVWARTAVERGVHKAPANEALRMAVALEHDVSKAEQEILNPNGINCIRQFPGIGIKVWGARTLATVGNPSWKYVNVRNLFNFLKRSMDRGLQWVVFEPNDQDLWGRVRRTLNSFLLVQWREGKLFGATPDTAFYVKCDAETNPQEMIDQGRLYVEIGINPVKPAEFVIIQIGQWTGGASITES